MDYYQMLNRAIAESGYSLRQISRKCQEEGLSITPSYISQLKNGKLPPPSWEVTKALSKVLNTPYESKMIFQGYLEKAPDIIKEYMAASSQLNKILLESLCEIKGESEITKEAVKFLDELDVLSTVNLAQKHIEDGKFKPSEDFVKDLKTYSKGLIPLEEDKSRYMLNTDEMEPLIPKGSLLFLKDTPAALLKTKDVILFKNGIITLVRRVYFYDEDILLVPDNKNAEIIRIYGFDEIDYLGKVVSYTKEF